MRTDEIDDLTLGVSSKTLQKFGLYDENIIWLRYNNEKRPFILERDGHVGENTVLMSNTAGDNIALENGDNVYSFKKEIPTVGLLQ